MESSDPLILFLWDIVDPLLFVVQCDLYRTPTFTLDRCSIDQQSTNNFAVRVGRREYPSITSRPVVYLSVVPTSSPEGIRGRLEVFGCNTTFLLFYLLVELQNYDV
jgi:hypothetical protein